MKSICCLHRLPLLLVTTLSLLSLCNCSILVGQVKPVEEKSLDKKMISVSEINSSWHILNQSKKEENAEAIPDAAWQSNISNSIIAIDSACRNQNIKGYDESSDLHELTDNLLSQWRNLKVISEKPTLLSGFPALETTAIGLYLNETRKFQTITVKSPSCSYDLIFLSQVNTFDQELSVFLKFRDNLKLK